jgi:hypothetical protein
MSLARSTGPSRKRRLCGRYEIQSTEQIRSLILEKELIKWHEMCLGCGMTAVLCVREYSMLSLSRMIADSSGQAYMAASMVTGSFLVYPR